MTQLCIYCGSTYDVIRGHVCHPTFPTTSTASTIAAAATPPAAPNYAAGISDGDIERIAEAVVRKLREQARRQGRPVSI